MRVHRTNSWCCCAFVCVCFSVKSYDSMLFLSFVFFTRKLHTRLFVFQTSNISPPSRCPRGRRGSNDTSVPLSTRHLFHWRRPLLGGIRRLAMTLTQPPPLHAHMHASTRLPIIPLLQITSHFHEQLRQSNRSHVWSVHGSGQAPLGVSHLLLSCWRNRS